MWGEEEKKRHVSQTAQYLNTVYDMSLSGKPAAQKNKTKHHLILRCNAVKHVPEIATDIADFALLM